MFKFECVILDDSSSVHFGNTKSTMLPMLQLGKELRQLYCKSYFFPFFVLFDV